MTAAPTTPHTATKAALATYRWDAEAQLPSASPLIPDTAIISTKGTQVLDRDVGTESQTPKEQEETPQVIILCYPLLAPSRAVSLFGAVAKGPPSLASPLQAPSSPSAQQARKHHRWTVSPT